MSQPSHGALISILVSLLALAAGVSGATGDVPEVLRVSAVPDESSTEMLRMYTPFADYLARELGMKVQFVPVVDYAATVEALVAKKLDLVWHGGFTSVQAVRRTGGQVTRLVMREEDTRFTAVFVSKPDGPIQRLGDLKGKTFAFGRVSSTSGHLMPRYFLLRYGIDPERDFGKKPAFSAADAAPALWVEAGKVDAGALNGLVWDKLVETRKVDPKKIAVFWRTPPFVDYVWTARSDLDAGLRERIVSAFLNLSGGIPEHRRILDLHRTKGFIRAQDEDWRGLEEAATAAGLLK
jgi:phosphonate transport system substrate-binding protein